MIEHWYEYLPAAWFIPEGRWYVIGSVLLLMSIAFILGYLVGRSWEKKAKIDAKTIEKFDNSTIRQFDKCPFREYKI